MKITAKVGQNEVIHSGLYIIPISDSCISLHMKEANFTFKISFEEKLDSVNGNEEFQRMLIRESNDDVADVLFYYRGSEKRFGATRKPNNLFYSLRPSENNEQIKLKEQYQFLLSAEIDRKNSITLHIQIIKTPETVHKD